MTEDGMVADKLDTWLSLPRLNFAPVNLAILLDIAFCEFKSDETNNIVEDSNWRALILKNEKLLTFNYFTSIKTHIDSANYNKDKLIRDFCYGK